MQLQVETQIYKKDAVKNAVIEAGSKANHYITLLNDQFGIRVHGKYNPDDPTAQPYSSFVQINSDDISMWRNNQKMMSLNDSTLIFYDGTGTQDSDKLAEFGSTIKIYNPTKGTAAVTINSAGATFEGDIVAHSLTLGENVSIDYSKVNNPPNLTVYIAKDGTIGTEPSDSSASSSTGFKVSSAGLLKAANAVITGKIFATAGIIGNWNIGTDSSKSLYYGNQTPGATDSNLVLSTSSATNSNAIGGSGTGLHWFISAGKVFGVTIDGALYSTSGHIGGWTIDENNLKSSSGTVGLKGSGTADTDVVFWAGNATPGGAPFRVTRAGALTATSGTIGGWTIDANNLKSSSGTVGLKGSGSTDTDVVFWAGNATSTSAPFRVTRAGALTATSATFGGSNGITITSSKVTLGSNCSISWNNVSDTGNVANISDIPTTAQITQITKDTVTTTYVNALNVTAKDISATTISGKTLSGNTISGGSINIGNGKFTVDTNGVLTATGATISGKITISDTTSNVYTKTAADSAFDVKGSAADAATKATNWISGDQNNGIKVSHSNPSGATTNFVQITGSGVTIVGDNANYKTTISSSGMNIYAGDSNSIACFGTIPIDSTNVTGVRVGKVAANTSNIRISPTSGNNQAGLYFYVNNTKVGSLTQSTNYTPVDSGITYNNALYLDAAQYLALRTGGNGSTYFPILESYADDYSGTEVDINFGSSEDPTQLMMYDEFNEDEGGGTTRVDLWGHTSKGGEEDGIERSAMVSIYSGYVTEDDDITGIGIGVIDNGDNYPMHGVWDHLKYRWLIATAGGSDAAYAGKMCCPGIFLNTTSNGTNVRILGANVSSWPDYGIARYVSSSRRYKEDIDDLTDNNLDADKLYDLRVAQFRYKEDYLERGDLRYGKLVPGFIAEEVEEVYPIAVQYDDEKAEDWEAKFIIPPMLKLIQEQKKKIDELEQRLEALERR